MGTGVLTGISAFTFDDLDRTTVVESKTTPGQNLAKLTSVYDAFDNLTSRVQQTGTGAAIVTVTTNYSSYDYLNRVGIISQTATNFPGWQNKSAKLEYRADSSLQTLTRYSDLTQTTIVVKTDFVQDSAGRLASLTHSRPAPFGNVAITLRRDVPSGLAFGIRTWYSCSNASGMRCSESRFQVDDAGERGFVSAERDGYFES